MSLLTLHRVHAGYGAIEVLHGIDLEVPAGGVVALLGANGAGKSTTMRAIAGLIAAKSGSIRYRDTDITSLDAAARVERGIALVPEGRLVFPTLSIQENLRLGAIVPRARAQTAVRMEAMYALFPRLAERRAQAAGSLSGGEQQMLAIARALMSQPTLVLLDEPTLGLAPLAAELVFQTVRRLRDEGLSILIAEQDVRRTLEIADRAHVIEHGQVVLSGSGASLAEDDRVRRALLGVQ